MAVSLSAAARDETTALAGRKVWLVEIEDSANGQHNLTNYNADIDFDGTTYTAFDIQVDSKLVQKDGGIDRSQLKVTNANKTPQTWYDDNGGLEGNTVTVRTLSPDATASGDEVRKKDMQIDKVEWDIRWATFRLTPFYDFFQRRTTQPITRDHCGKFVPKERKLRRKQVKEAKS